MANTVEPLNETVRRLRDEGRSRAAVGPWHITLSERYAMFEHEDDRARRLEQPAKPSAPRKSSRRTRRRR